MRKLILIPWETFWLQEATLKRRRPKRLRIHPIPHKCIPAQGVEFENRRLCRIEQGMATGSRFFTFQWARIASVSSSKFVWCKPILAVSSGGCPGGGEALYGLSYGSSRTSNHYPIASAVPGLTSENRGPHWEDRVQTCRRTRSNFDHMYIIFFSFFFPSLNAHSLSCQPQGGVSEMVKDGKRTENHSGKAAV